MYTGSIHWEQSTIKCKNYNSPLRHELKKKKKIGSLKPQPIPRVLKKKSIRSGKAP